MQQNMEITLLHMYIFNIKICNVCLYLVTTTYNVECIM